LNNDAGQNKKAPFSAFFAVFDRAYQTTVFMLPDSGVAQSSRTATWPETDKAERRLSQDTATYLKSAASLPPA